MLRRLRVRSGVFDPGAGASISRRRSSRADVLRTGVEQYLVRAQCQVRAWHIAGAGPVRAVFSGMAIATVVSRSRSMIDARRGAFAGHLCFAAAVYLALHTWLFWTPLSTGQYLAFTDLWDVFLPAFAAPYTLWSDYEYGGFPVFADPQSGHFYPVQQLFSRVFQSWTWYL